MPILKPVNEKNAKGKPNFPSPITEIFIKFVLYSLEIAYMK